MAFAYQTAAGSATDATTYTFSALAIGAAVADRMVVNIWSGGAVASRSVSSATNGGISSTVITGAAVQGITQPNVMTRTAVPTGTTADAVVTWSGSMSRCGVGQWTASGLSSHTPIDAQGSTANPGVIALSVDNGYVVAGADDDSGGTTSWTNATERYDADIESGRMHSGADASPVALGSLSLTATRSASSAPTMVAAAWALQKNFLIGNVGFNEPPMFAQPMMVGY